MKRRHALGLCKPAHAIYAVTQTGRFRAEIGPFFTQKFTHKNRIC